jgi:hypothetical protein
MPRVKPCSRCGINPRTATSRGWCSQCNREYDREWRKKTNYQAKRRLKDKSMTREEYDLMMESQGGACAICGTTDPDGTWHIDHDHNCCPGQVTCGECTRGALCANCNRALGGFGDSVANLKSAVRYLEAWNATQEEE